MLRWLIALGLSFLGLNALGALTGFGTVVSVYAFYAQQLPEPGAIQQVEDDFETTKLYDRTGEHLLYEILDPLGGDRTWLELDDIPPDLRQATIAIEDKTFYENPGYNAEGIFRAAWSNLTGEGVQGGSSITQQLVKNVLIEPEERTQISYERKLKELILAVRLNNAYSKDQILEWYLNTNFYGNLAYGAEAAAAVYFDKPARELSLAESAMLAAIPQSPALNPIDNYPQAKQRQRAVLDAMVEQGMITANEADLAFDAPLDIQQAEQRFDLLAPHFSIAARKQLESLFDPEYVYRGGLVVYTTLDYDLQLQAECAARSQVARLSGAPADTVVAAADGSPCQAADYLYPLSEEHAAHDHNVSNAAVVVMKPTTGEVLTLLGSADYYDEAIDGNFNVALAERQPGSAFKPFTYLTAFMQGYTPATMTLDVRTAFDVGSNQPYVPENFDRTYHGPQSIRSALANSYNVPAVQVLEWVGIDNTIRTAHAMGINTLDRGLDYYGLSLTLGGGETTLYDMTYAYGVLANSGVMAGTPIPQEERRPGYRTLDPTLLLRVETRDGDVLWEYGEGRSFNRSAVVEPALAYLMNDILSDEAAREPSVGAESALQLGRPSAVKTGTTNDYRDNLTIGYTPQLVTGVWVGNTDNSEMIALPAIVGAAPLWHAVMEYALQDEPVEAWAAPSDVVEMTVCETSGLLPTGTCPTREEIFKAGTEPTSPDDIYQPFLVNRETGRLATVYTPADLVEEQVFMVLPPEAADWVRQQGIPQPPDEYDTVDTPEAYGDVAIISPSPFDTVRGAVSIRGNARDAAFAGYRLDVGSGINPTEWTQIGSSQSTPRANAELGVWNARGPDGLYSLRLTMVRNDSSIETFIVPVTVDNTPPIVDVLYPEDGQTYTADDEYVIIQPTAIDNISMDRVEFYVDGQLAATSTVAPFNERWLIGEPGTHFIELRATDSAGNTTVSGRITIEVLGD